MSTKRVHIIVHYINCRTGVWGSAFCMLLKQLTDTQGAAALADEKVLRRSASLLEKRRAADAEDNAEDSVDDDDDKKLLDVVRESDSEFEQPKMPRGRCASFNNLTQPALLQFKRPRPQPQNATGRTFAPAPNTKPRIPHRPGNFRRVLNTDDNTDDDVDDDEERQNRRLQLFYTVHTVFLVK